MRPQQCYFLDRAGWAQELLDRAIARFDPSSRDHEHVYLWLAGIYMAGKPIGGGYFSRRGRFRLLGLYRREMLWIRERIYTCQLIPFDDLVDSNGRLRPQDAQDRTIDYETLIQDVVEETRILLKIFRRFAKIEEGMIKQAKDLTARSLFKRESERARKGSQSLKGLSKPTRASGANQENST